MKSFDYFGHSNKLCFCIDYGTEILAVSTQWLHERDLGKIRSSIFASNAYCKSWGCHTGESMSKAWRQATGKKMIGAIGKTNYGDGHLRGWIPALSEGSRWGG